MSYQVREKKNKKKACLRSSRELGEEIDASYVCLVGYSQQQ